ncbi:MAG: DUF5071 domain-containing protein [Oscillospiraceae bacterium]|nr:DUF5071 domain-containing protein [Oscillospiraceae bacterium]
MTNIDRIMYLIDWKRSPAEQREGIFLAREVICIKAFFQPIGPGYSKSVWENCATIICERSDEELQPYITDMILWIEDLNWPGAEKIQQRLIAFQDVTMLSSALNSIVPALEKLKKTSWLIFISVLLSNQELSLTISNSTKEILTKYSLY